MRLLSTALFTLFATALVQAAPIPAQADDSSLQHHSGAHKHHSHSSLALKHFAHASSHHHELSTNEEAHDDLEGRSFEEDGFDLEARGWEGDEEEVDTPHHHLAGSVNHAHKSHASHHLATRGVWGSIKEGWTRMKNKVLGPKRVKNGKGSANLSRRDLEARGVWGTIKEGWTRMKNKVLGPKRVKNGKGSANLSRRGVWGTIKEGWTRMKNKVLGPKRVKNGKGSANLSRREE